MDKLRNVILVGHQASGKTTLAEAILFNAGVNSRAGRVEDGNTTMDSSPEEISKVISIDAGVAFCEIAKTKVNILDTPGYEDFVGQVLSCLPVVEGGVIVMSAESGVEAGTVKTWSYLDRYRLPRVVCINKMDKEHADFDKCLDEAQSQLGAKVAPFQIPIGQGESFKGVVDVLKGKAYVYSGDGKFAETDVPADLKGKVDEALQRLVDFAAEADDSLLEKFLGGEKLSDEELRKGLAAGCIAGTLVPLYVASAPRNIGVHQLMDSIVTMLPSPAWRVGDRREGSRFGRGGEGEDGARRPGIGVRIQVRIREERRRSFLLQGFRRRGRRRQGSPQREHRRGRAHGPALLHRGQEQGRYRIGRGGRYRRRGEAEGDAHGAHALRPGASGRFPRRPVSRADAHDRDRRQGQGGRRQGGDRVWPSSRRRIRPSSSSSIPSSGRCFSRARGSFISTCFSRGSRENRASRSK